jgi:hypothetical protein
MSLETDNRTEIEIRKNKSVRTELYIIELNNGEILYLTNNNQNVNWNNNKYIAYPIRRGKSNQSGGQTVNQVSVSFGDRGFFLTRLLLNDIDIFRKATIKIFQQIENTDGVGIIFRQIFKGIIINMSGQRGMINFTVVEPYNDFSKPVNRRKFGEISGVVDINERLF